VPAQPICDLAVHPDDDDCHTRNGLAELLTGAEPEGGHGSNDCCDAGCHDCGLPCCIGIAMILASAPSVGAGACLRVQSLPFGSNLSWVDPDPFYRPPRS
jgi:hypothetical protein